MKIWASVPVATKMKTALLVCFALVAISLAEKPRKITLQERVINGHDASKNEFPHQISLQYNQFGFYSHICGGSILNKNWVVTAGHCIIASASNFKVVAGILNLNDNGQEVKVSRTIVHPDYEGGVNPNDIALLELSSPLTLNDAVKAINLPSSGATPTGDAIISGWGSTSTSGSPIMPDVLQTTTLEIVNHKDCANALTGILGSSDPLDERSNVCTGPLNQSTGACSGDSGGPLIQGQTLIGVVSWGIMPCGYRGAPSVFTKVSSFVDFINQNIN